MKYDQYIKRTTLKKKIALIFGGKSNEFEVSLVSASNIYKAIDKNKFEVVLIGIDKKGNWFINQNFSNYIFTSFFDQATKISIQKYDDIALIIDSKNFQTLTSFDIAFSIIHGTYGEDGTLQGFFRTLNIPFVGPDVLGSAICMDKEITKRVLRDNNIPIANFISLRKANKNNLTFNEAADKLGLPMFIKPCNAGSSVGVNKVIDEKSFYNSIDHAFKYDNKILIEEAIVGKEIECAILGNEVPKASVIGEITPTKEFYTYDAKYNDSDGAKMKIPAEINLEITEKLQETAIKAFKALECDGLSRVDFFLKNDNSFVINEINTLPGFTEISMYPKLWEESGINYSDLITELIVLAEQKFRDNIF